jgi:hypothetical protein
MNKVPQFLTFSAAIAFALWAVITIDAWLAAQGPAAAYGRIAVVLAVATAGAAQWRRSLRREYCGLNSDESIAVSPGCSPAKEDVLRELLLAIEHIQSIRILLEISHAHRQPVPLAVSANLNLVLKSLRKACTQLSRETAREVVQPIRHKPAWDAARTETVRD